MADVVSRAIRSRMMSGIRSKNTRPEMLIRRGLFARGFRYRLHARGLPGNPDIVLPKYRAVVMVHGCFWHRHGCGLFKWPSSNAAFWRAKLNRNRLVDRRANQGLLALGWRVSIVWECALRGASSAQMTRVTDRLCRWLVSNRKSLRIDSTT
jgi:DNA mismatch endonuclease (patch repair protein)